MHAQALAIIMDTFESEYKARIEELEKRDPSKQLKATAKILVVKLSNKFRIPHTCWKPPHPLGWVLSRLMP